MSIAVGDLTINGVLAQNVASFRNLKYAQIAGRWHEARLLDLASQGVWDATQWGPRAPQTIDVGHAATSHLYPRMSTHDATCEFECLSLNVYTPAAALQTCHALPVIVWIHGGSFAWGDGSQYGLMDADGQHLVSHSIHTNQPVVVVGINYRLGMLGFFTSEELRQEARERGEAGYSNLGFHDQRVALQWVHENIHLFGGDASRITLAGESAGAISVLAHLRGKLPVAASALLMSPATISPKSFAQTQVTFDKACAALGITREASAADKIAALRQLPCEKLHELGANRLETMLCEDGVFFEDWSGQRFEQLSVLPAWIRRIVVGQMSEELTVMTHAWSSLPPEELLDAWRRLYPDPEYAEQVLATYEVEQENAGNVLRGLVDYASDALFDMAVRSIAETHLHKHDEQPRVHVYRFEQPDLVAPGKPHRGHAYHSLDNAFFFHFPSVTGEQAPREMRTTADDFCGMALRLAHGDELWEREKLAVFSGEGLRVLEMGTPRWAKLVDTADKMDQFLLGKEMLWKMAEASRRSRSTA